MSGSCDEKTLEIAKQNLDKYFLVAGITEDTDNFIQAVSSMYNIMPAAIARTQVTHDKIFDKVPKNIQQKLLAKHKYDLKLYEHVKEKWNKWKQNNIIATLPFNEQQKILTILGNYGSTREAVYMNSDEIKQYNLEHEKNKLIQIIQQRPSK